MKTILRRFVGVCICLICLSLESSYASVTVTNFSVADTMIHNDPVFLNKQGTNSVIYVGINGTTGNVIHRGLFKFDLLSIPANSTVASAELIVSSVVKAGIVNSWFDLHKVLVPWNEAGVTWTNRLIGIPWSILGSSSPTDYSSLVTQSNFMTTNLTAFTFASNTEMVSDVQDWISNPASNFGWFMISEADPAGLRGTVRQIASREYPVVTNRPMLVVTYNPGPAPVKLLGTLDSLNSSLLLNFNARSNWNYRVEYADMLPTQEWTTLTNITANTVDAQMIITNADFISTPKRFYRVWTY